MRRVLALAAVLLLVAGACRDRDGGPVDYSREARFPDDQGEVTSVDFEQIELEGTRRHPISTQVQSFSTYTGDVTPLLFWDQKYVHVGLDADGTVIWVAGLGTLDRSVDPPVVFYTNGVFKRVDDERNAIFEDGTVLELSPEAPIPPADSRVTARIDTSTHTVSGFTLTED